VAGLIRVLLVDDHPIVLRGMRDALEHEPDMVVVGEAQTIDEARAALRSGLPEVVLVDVRLADGSGLELLGDRGDDGPAWIVLSSFDSTQYLAAALDLGAAGFLLKTAPLEEVLAAIRRVSQGGTAFESRQLQAARDLRRIRLTDRERQVVNRLVAGRSNDEIGLDLGVARKTVEAYLTRLYERFGVTSRTEFALRMERDGWPPLDDVASVDRRGRHGERRDGGSRR
jgi:two-component system, NarL family, response regulator DevR